MGAVLYVLLTAALSYVGFLLLKSLPVLARLAVIGLGVGLLLAPVWVSDAAGGYQDYWSPAWIPALFENVFVREATGLGERALMNLLMGGGAGLVIAVGLGVVYRQVVQQAR
ncbi:MAG: hypothetical protein SVC26_08785 [Pseudomonadota bacterium]|nr:hypothetical protein [Pseudomonadota bacterium]